MLARPPQAARRRLRTIAVHESCANRSCGANDSRSQYKAFEQDARSGCSRSTHIAPALRPRCGRVRPRAERLPARRGQRDQVDHEARSCSSLLGWLQMAYGNITDNETLLVDDFLHRCIHLVLNGR